MHHAHAQPQEWTELHFKNVTLKELGLIIQLGHPPRERCINPARAYNDNFVIIDTDMIHCVCLYFCNCTSAETHDIQLLRAQLYPSTSQNPRTAATFRVLRGFHLLTLMSKVSAFEFYYTIARQTDNSGTSPPPVSPNSAQRSRPTTETAISFRTVMKDFSG